jgi:hypothetical protein
MPTSRAREPCLRCGRLALVQRRVDGHSMCASCERRWLNSTARCARCHQRRRPALGRAHAGLCETCAGIISTQICGRCGAEEDLYASTRCAACCLADEIDSMRATGHPDAVQTLDRYLNALQAARPANRVLHWLRVSRTSAAPLLRDLVTGARPITHDTLDNAASGHATEFLRAALVKHGALPERDEICHRFERWIITTTDQLPDHLDRANLRRWANWIILRDLRGRRQHSVTASDRAARTRVRVARDFVAWIHQHQLTLATTGQHDVDRWVAEGTSTRRQIRTFLRWTSKTKLTPPLDTSTPPEHRQGVELADDRRRRLITQLLHDANLELRTRVVGLLVLLYGQPLARVTRLRVEHIHHHDDHTSIALGRDRLTLSPPIDTLVRQLAAAPQGSTLHDRTGDGWLFPGQLAGAPITPERLRRRVVQQLGPLPIRHSALTARLQTTPAPVLADLLGFSHNRADRWARATGTSYSNYVAARHNAVPP